MLKEILNVFEDRYKNGLNEKKCESAHATDVAKVLRIILNEKMPSTFKYCALLNELKSDECCKASLMDKIQVMTS